MTILPFRSRAPELSPNDAHYVDRIQELLKDCDGLYRNAFWVDAGECLGIARELTLRIDNVTARHGACDDIARMKKFVKLAEDLAVRRV